MISFTNNDTTIYLISDNDVISINGNNGEINWNWRNISVHIIDNFVGKNDSIFILSVDNCVREIKNGEVRFQIDISCDKSIPTDSSLV